MKIIFLLFIIVAQLIANDPPVEVVKNYIKHIQNKDFKAAYTLLSSKDKRNQPFWFYSEIHSHPIKDVRRVFRTIGGVELREYYKNIENIIHNKDIEFISIDKTSSFANATFQTAQQLINIKLTKNGTKWYIDANLKNYQSFLEQASILKTKKLLKNWLFDKIYLNIDYNERFYLFTVYKRKYLDTLRDKDILNDSSMKYYHEAKKIKEFFDSKKFVISNTRILKNEDKEGVELSFENNSDEEIKNIFAEFIYIDENNNIVKKGSSALLPPGKTLKAKEKIVHPYKFLPPNGFKGKFKIRPITLLFMNN